MVSYVLLVVIAVGVSVVVFNFLSTYTPKEHAECSEDVRVVLQSYSCNVGSPGVLNVTLLNKGVFSVDAVYIRFGAQSRTVKDLINDNDLYFTRIVGNSNPGLAPGASASKTFQLPVVAGTKYGLEIEPAVFSEKNELALCPQATITQEIACN